MGINSVSTATTNYYGQNQSKTQKHKVSFGLTARAAFNILERGVKASSKPGISIEDAVKNPKIVRNMDRLTDDMGFLAHDMGFHARTPLPKKKDWLFAQNYLIMAAERLKAALGDPVKYKKVKKKQTKFFRMTIDTYRRPKTKKPAGIDVKS